MSFEAVKCQLANLSDGSRHNTIAAMVNITAERVRPLTVTKISYNAIDST